MNAKELYPNEEEGYSFVYDYDPIVNSFGTVVIKVDDDDYQGDSRVLYADGEKIGYLNFGWGSCSGCDSLQACNTFEAVDQLIDELRNDIMWFESKKDALEWFNSHDWQGDYSWSSDKHQEFIGKVVAYLSE